MRRAYEVSDDKSMIKDGRKEVVYSRYTGVAESVSWTLRYITELLARDASIVETIEAKVHNC